MYSLAFHGHNARCLARGHRKENFSAAEVIPSCPQRTAAIFLSFPSTWRKEHNERGEKAAQDLKTLEIDPWRAEPGWSGYPGGLYRLERARSERERDLQKIVCKKVVRG